VTLFLIVGLFFMAILIGILALYSGYAVMRESPSFELKKRLRNLAVQSDEIIPLELRVEILGEMTPLEKALYRFSAVRKIEKLADSAGIKMDIKRFLLVILISSLGSFCAGLLLRRGIAPALVLLVLGAWAPLVYLRVRRKKRAQLFTEQFPEALDMLARSLKSGHAMSMAIKLVGTEMSDPIAGLFKTAYEEQTLGLSMQDALSHMLQRVPSMDLQLFVTAVNIHREIGGNLAETLERLANTIRERLKLRRQVRVFTAQARLSGIILFLLPIFMAVFFYFSTPGYMEELFTTPAGKIAIIYAIVSQMIGFLVIRKIVNIRI
jgi:tight adherence protein B